MFIVFGASSNSYKGVRATRNGMKGFVPFIYEFDRLMGDTVYYLKTCCMCGCGAYLAKNDGKTFIYLDDEKTEECYTTLKNWNSLVLYKDETFKI